MIENIVVFLRGRYTRTCCLQVRNIANFVDNVNIVYYTRKKNEFKY